MLTRRGLFAAAGVAICGGAATGAAPAKPKPLDVDLIRVTPDGLRKIGWFDQRPGDKVIGIWKSGRIEGWDVTGEPYMHPRNGEAVPIEGEVYYCSLEPKSAFVYDPLTDSLTAMRANSGLIETFKAKPTAAALARRPRPTRPLIGRPVIVAK